MLDMLAKVTAIQFFSFAIALFPFTFLFSPNSPCNRYFFTNTNYTNSSVEKEHFHSRMGADIYLEDNIFTAEHTPHTANKQTNNPKQKLLSLVTSSSVTSPVKKSVATVAADPLSIFVLPKSTESPILQISKSFKSRTVYRKELARCFELFSDRRGNETGFAFQFSCSIMSDSLRLHELQHARPPCPSPTPGVYPNPCPSSR